MRWLLLLAWLIPFLIGCRVQTGINKSSTLQKPFVVLVSIDGFRSDYAELHGANTLKDMAKTGVFASMRPSFPSKTFPNHYTLITGMYPGSHGLLANSFYSRSKGEEYSMKDRSKVKDGSWYGGTPIWVLAEHQGMVSASYFWVGSEAPIQGIQPTFVYDYDGSVPNQERVDQVKAWLQLPEKERPHMITLYFSIVDSQGHRYGPGSKETGDAVKEVDALLGDLRTFISTSGLPIYLVVVSDHGMVDVNERVDVSHVDFKKARVINAGSQLDIFVADTAAYKHITSELSKDDRLHVYPRTEIPIQYHYENVDRTPDVLVTVDPPYQIRRNSERNVFGGAHGFDPYKHKEMLAIFYAEGPGLKKGHQLDTFENIHLYPLLTHLLRLKSPPVDGDERLIDLIFD